MARIREARMEDLEALGRVAYATGFFGASAEAYFPSPALFRDLWVRPYLAGAGCCNFLAERDGRVLGYIVGTCDLRAYRAWMLGHGARALKDALFGRYPAAWGALPFLLRMARHPGRHAPADRFPAQLHVNLLPEARGLGLGGGLMERYLDCLRARGVPGVQLSATLENAAALGLYRKFGFETYRSYSSPLWRPWLGRPARHVVMARSAGLRVREVPS